MITTPEHAKRIIARLYGPAFKYRILSRAVTYANPPLSSGKPHLAWRRLCPGQDSAIRLGLVSSDGCTINWDWQDEHSIVRAPVLSKGTLKYRTPDGRTHELDADAATLASINTKLSQHDALVDALQEALKLVNGDNTRKASDVLREQWERLLNRL